MDMIKERLDEGQGETIYEIGTGGKIQVLSYPYDFFLTFQVPVTSFN